MEFVALGNHRKAIRAEIASSGVRFRTEQLDALRRALDRQGIGPEQCPPMVFAVLMTSVARMLVVERASLGMSEGHAETVAFVEEFLTRLEGPRSLGSERSAAAS